MSAYMLVLACWLTLASEPIIFEVPHASLEDCIKDGEAWRASKHGCVRLDLACQRQGKVV